MASLGQQLDAAMRAQDSAAVHAFILTLNDHIRFLHQLRNNLVVLHAIPKVSYGPSDALLQRPDSAALYLTRWSDAGTEAGGKALAVLIGRRSPTTGAACVVVSDTTGGNAGDIPPETTKAMVEKIVGAGYTYELTHLVPAPDCVSSAAASCHDVVDVAFDVINTSHRYLQWVERMSSLVEALLDGMQQQRRAVAVAEEPRNIHQGVARVMQRLVFGSSLNWLAGSLRKRRGSRPPPAAPGASASTAAAAAAAAAANAATGRLRREHSI